LSIKKTSRRATLAGVVQVAPAHSKKETVTEICSKPVSWFYSLKLVDAKIIHATDARTGKPIEAVKYSPATRVAPSWGWRISTL